MIKIGIIDDNVQFTELLKDFLSTINEMKVIGVAHNGMEGMELIEKKKPDLIILDLIMPFSDGLSLLKNIYEEGITTKVIMLTSIGTDEIITQAKELGASYFLMKPIELSNLPNMIMSICLDSVLQKTTLEKKIHNTNNDDKLELKISDILRSIGIPANLKGYFFLREAIQMINNGCEISFSKVIYPAIASKYHTTPSRVERAIRHAIEVGWNRGGIEQLDFIFGNTVIPLKGKPTNGEFIAFIAEHLMLKGMEVGSFTSV
ncbi:two-component system response regulator (stage 0 sporulation protein A) [Neobacillus niacini]|uniref:sporulation transcription factor Spo0A n=1 Tax=Neobacillus driksii TaxID=3035913 RepID=UPI002788B64B|nr:sporulation transcription factor Spo0A [Neobacillus niacini]MDQ0970584.1 two-component system response regulator (stage 0 sporulation protein A) [Neobacillus niacini]